MNDFKRVNLNEYFVVSLWFGCNNNCVTCMLSGIRNDLAPIGFEQFKKIVDDAKARGEFRNIILSGAEVTLLEDLDRYVSYVKDTGFFNRIQVQTNGRRLKNKEYLDHIVSLGVNEFFISINGFENTHDCISRSPGSYRDTMEGLHNLADYDVNVISNTVLSGMNFHEISRLIDFLVKRNISEIHIWNYFPMEPFDSKNLIISIPEFIKILPGLSDTAEKSGKPLVLKGFPECLQRDELPVYFDSDFPVTVLPEKFWEKFEKSGFGYCPHREKCCSSTCWGISKAYTEKYGDGRDILKPLE